MLASVIAASIVVRFGLIEALLRFYYLPDGIAPRVVSTGFAALFWATTARRCPWAWRSPSRSPRRCSTTPTPSSPGSRCSASGR